MYRKVSILGPSPSRAARRHFFHQDPPPPPPLLPCHSHHECLTLPASKGEEEGLCFPFWIEGKEKEGDRRMLPSEEKEVCQENPEERNMHLFKTSYRHSRAIVFFCFTKMFSEQAQKP